MNCNQNQKYILDVYTIINEINLCKGICECTTINKEYCCGHCYTHPILWRIDNDDIDGIIYEEERRYFGVCEIYQASIQRNGSKLMRRYL